MNEVKPPAMRVTLKMCRSLAPKDLWHWVVVFENGHVFQISKESFVSAELCMANAATAGLDALHAAEAALWAATSGRAAILDSSANLWRGVTGVIQPVE